MSFLEYFENFFIAKWFYDVWVKCDYWYSKNAKCVKVNLIVFINNNLSIKNRISYCIIHN